MTKLEHVGFFLRLNEELAGMFPRLRDDDSPPHITVAYVGDCTEKEYLRLAAVGRKITEGYGRFGVRLGDVQHWENAEGEKVSGLVVISPELRALNKRLIAAIDAAGLPRSKKYKGFKPHVTLRYGAGKSIRRPPSGTFLAASIEMWGGRIIRLSLEPPVMLKAERPTLQKSLPDARFFATIMGEKGKSTPIGAGKFGARWLTYKNGVRAVLKPQVHGNDVFRGIPRNQTHMREAAAYQIDRQLLGFDIVPPTALTVVKSIPAVVQMKANGVPAKQVVQDPLGLGAQEFMAKVNYDQLRELIILDLVIGNVDRHLGNALFDTTAKRVWAIDNGCSFTTPGFSRYRNFFHRGLFRKGFVLTDEERVRLALITKADLVRVLDRYLPSAVFPALWARIRTLVAASDLGYDPLFSQRPTVVGASRRQGS